MKKYMKKAADLLAEGRALRLRGLTEDASILETKGEFALIGRGLDIDTLMTTWENSLAKHPRELPEWREAGLK